MIERNKSMSRGKPLLPLDQEMFGPAAAVKALDILRLHPSYRPSPLRPLREVATSAGLQSVHIKDESGRFGLGSFKSLGGAYAVVCLALEEAGRILGRTVHPSELLDPDVRALVRNIDVGCATDGNHGRSVAAGANLAGCRANIFVHEGVSPERIAAIARFGANVIEVDGNYDDAVAEAERVCHANDWIIVSDTSWPGYERIPRLVMQGYTVMVSEILDEMAQPPTHVFLQAGVGGFAAAIAANLTLRTGAARPKFIVVEPDRAACLLASNEADAPVKIAPLEPTVMAMLECYEPSMLAWGILSRLAEAYMTVGDADAIAAMKRLARTENGRSSVIAGESGGAGLAGLLAAANDPQSRALLGLNADSRALLFNTEGATDPSIYKSLTGVDPRILVPA